MRITLLLLISVLLPNFIYSQVIDNSRLLYDDSQTAVIKIAMDPNAYEYLVSHPHEDSLQLCSIHFKNAFIDDTLSNVGIRIRGNTSRDSRKLSFKLSFDDYEPGREFYGVEKLNLNGEHNDPSISRAKICWDLFGEAGIKATRSAHAALYINNIYHGVYISIEHLDKEFLKRNFNDASGNLWKCLYPADLTYKGNTPSSYFYSESFPAYELITNKQANDYSQLARFIKIINNTPSSLFADSLESILVVSDYLKYQAMNIILGSWDDYWSLMNNYYLYYNPAMGKFNWIPYDYDNSMGIDWSGTNWTNASPYNFPQVVRGNRPLITNLLKLPEYRNLFTHFLQFYNNNLVTPERMNSKIDSIKNMISVYAHTDSFRTLDYGFTYDDFFNSFDMLQKDHVKKGIKEFISQRNSSLKGQLNYLSSKPSIYAVTHQYSHDSVYIYASAFDNSVIKSITITGAGSENYQMYFSPVYNLKVEDSDRWAAAIPVSIINSDIEINLEAENNSNVSITKKYNLQFIQRSPGVVINEILADNNGITPDPAGENDDWIELFNSSDEPFLLSDMYLTDKSSEPKKWQFTQPELYLNPKEYLVVWCDENQDDNQPGIHAGFKLSKGGEFIGLSTGNAGEWIDSISFGNQATDVSYSRLPDGFNTWAYTNPTPGMPNILTGINENHTMPSSFEAAAYPNPFNPSTNIYYSISSVADIKINIYDILGNEVFSLYEDNSKPGKYIYSWNAEDKHGLRLSSGIYFCKISAGDLVKVHKLMLMK